MRTNKPLLCKIFTCYDQKWLLIISHSGTSAISKGSRYMQVNYGLLPRSKSTNVVLVSTTFPGGKNTITNAIKFCLSRGLESPVPMSVLQRHL